MNEHASSIHQEAQDRTEAHIYARRHFWDKLTPAKYHAAFVRVFQAYRREVIGL
jgi:hypothetical protein